MTADEGTIRIFIATQPLQERAHKVLIHSIRSHTNTPIDIRLMCLGEPGFDDWHGKTPTGFTMFRFAVPALCNFQGMAIILDPDMLVLGDIAELATYYSPGHWCKFNGPEGDCVSVIDCHAVGRLTNWPSMAELKSGTLRKWDVRPKLQPILKGTIPPEWNSMDKLSDDTRLIHYTNLATQPWHPNPKQPGGYKKHEDPAAEKMWFQWEEKLKAFGGGTA